jgi:hypothetical protein
VDGAIIAGSNRASLEIFHAPEVKKLLEATTFGGLQVRLLDGRVCARIEVMINIDYSKLTTGQYSELKETIKKINEKREKHI